MIAEIMSHSLVVTAVLTAMGFTVEALARGRGFSRRLGWAASMGLSTLLLVALIATAGTPPKQADPVMEGEYSALGGVVTVFVHPEANTLGTQLSMIPFQILALPVAGWDSGIDLLGAASRGGSAVLGSLPGGDTSLGALWATLTVGGLLLFLLSAGRLRRRTRILPVERIAGRPISVDHTLGPAVIGIFRPKIVLPRWLLSAPNETLSIVVAHEEEHLRARDTLLLAAGLGAVVLAPWNPFTWIQLRRLRLAIEIDCDRRVVKRGITPTQYASLLLDLGNRPASLPLGATALAEPPALLERRMKNLCKPFRRISRLRANAIGAAALLLLIAACTAPVRETPGAVIPAPSPGGGIEPIMVEAEAQAVANQPERTQQTESGRSCVTLADGDSLCGESLTLLSRDDAAHSEAASTPQSVGTEIEAARLTRVAEFLFTHSGDTYTVYRGANGEYIVPGIGTTDRPTPGSQDEIVVVGYGATARPSPAPIEEITVVGYGATARPSATSSDVITVIGYGPNARVLEADTVEVEGQAPAAQPAPPRPTAPAPQPAPAPTPTPTPSASPTASQTPASPVSGQNPVFVRVEAYPEVRNVDEVRAALVREYPAELREQRIGGRVLMHVYVDARGIVADCRVAETSGHQGLDQAALRVCPVYSFVPARNNGESVAAWIAVPIDFSAR